MARTTLEDKWWTDPRRSTLIDELKSELLVDGLAIKLFRVAQDYWKNGSGGIPFKIFALLPHAQSLIRSGLVSVQDRLGSACVSFSLASFSFEFRSGVSVDEMVVFVRGSAEYLDWLRVHKENSAEAGKKSAESRKKKGGSAQPKVKKPRSNPEPNATNAEPAGSNVEPSSSVSSSSSVSGSRILPSEGAQASLTPEVEDSAGQVISEWFKLWKEKYNDLAPLQPKDYGLLKGVVTGQGKVRALELVRAYFKMPDSWAVLKSHDVVTFQQNLAKVAAYVSTGAVTTVTQVRQQEKTHANMSAGAGAGDYFRNKKALGAK